MLTLRRSVEHAGMCVMEDPAFWRLDVFLLLALEWTAPFLGDLGLDGADPKGVRWVARRFVERFAEARRAGDRGAMDAVHLSTWQEITSELGDAAADAIFTLGSLPPIDQELWWTALFQAAVFDIPAGAHIVPWPIGGPKATMVWEAAERGLRPGLRERVERLGLGDADRELLHRYDTGSDHRFDPAEATYELATILRFRATWRQIEATLTPEEIGDLVEWARRQAFAIGIPSDAIERPG